VCAQYDKCTLQKVAEAVVRMCVEGKLHVAKTAYNVTAAYQPTGADHCRQCGMSIDLEGVATVDKDVLVSAVTGTLYERYNS
jgi:hypothetical protein